MSSSPIHASPSRLPSEGRRTGPVDDLIAAALKQGVLYHDLDHGQACFECENCPGFELHFWRKICVHCKCSKASHGNIQLKQRKVGRLSGLEQLTTMVELARLSLEQNAPVENNRRRSSFERRPSGGDALFERKTSGSSMSPMSSASRLAPMLAGGNDTTPTGSGEPVQASPRPSQPAPPSAYRLTFAWAPAELDDDQLKRFMEGMPEDRRPIIGTEGERHRLLQLEKQLPSYDWDVTTCKGMTSDREKAEFIDFVKNRLGFAGQGRVIDVVKSEPCFRCGHPIKPGQFGIECEGIRVGSTTALLHYDTCFTCEVCDHSLVDLFHFVFQDNRVLCGRHWSDMMRPRCATCDETIFAEDYTNAEEQTFHLQHFCCEICDALIVDQKYTAIHGKPHCLSCFQNFSAPKCSACAKLILPTSRMITDGKDGGKKWHADCFVCVECKQPLEGIACFPKDTGLYCREDYNKVYKKVSRSSLRGKLKKKSKFKEPIPE